MAQTGNGNGRPDGRVVRVIGPVVDVEFPPEELPEITFALELDRTLDEETDTIVCEGQCDFDVMRRNHVSTHDLDEDMRLSAHTDDLSKIRVARVERSGDISFIKK